MPRGTGWLLGACCSLGLAAACTTPRSSGPGLDPPHGPVQKDSGLPGVVPGLGSAGSTGSTVSNGTGGGGSISQGHDAGKSPPTRDAGTGTTGSGGSASTPNGNAGASDETDGGAASANPATHDAWFVGYWVVDQPAHALYEATLYELAAGGALIVHDTMVTGTPPYAGYVTGSVDSSQSGVRCDIDSWWASEGNRRVQLGSTCTDGTPRTVVISFANTDATEAVMPTIESVASESGWTHPDPVWSWRKCQSRDACPPF